jgi:hypothetical protein
MDLPAMPQQSPQVAYFPSFDAMAWHYTPNRPATIITLDPRDQSVRIRRSRAHSGVCRQGCRARSAYRRSGGRAEGLPHFSAPIWEIVADSAGADRDGSAGRADRAGHRQQLQLVRRVSRGIRPGAPERGDSVGPGARLAPGRHLVDTRRGGRRRAGGVSQRADGSRHRAAGRRGLRPARAAGRRPPAHRRRRARRVSGDRRLQRRIGGARAARGGAAAARSATCSPNPSRL